MNGGGGSHGIQIKPRLRGRGPFYPNSLSFTVSYHKAPEATRLLTAFVRERNILLKLEAAAAAAQARLLCPAHQLSEAPQRPQRGLLSGPQNCSLPQHKASGAAARKPEHWNSLL